MKRKNYDIFPEYGSQSSEGRISVEEATSFARRVIPLCEACNYSLGEMWYPQKIRDKKRMIKEKSTKP